MPGLPVRYETLFLTVDGYRMPQLWNPHSRAVAMALLDHHRAICRAVAGDERSDVALTLCIVTFDELRALAGISGIAGGLGRHLRRIAIWCQAEGFPPLHALAVKSRSGDPGVGYERSPGISGDWNEDVRRCIHFGGYPEAVR